MFDCQGQNYIFITNTLMIDVAAFLAFVSICQGNKEKQD